MRSSSSKHEIRERFAALAAAYATSRVHAQGESLGRLVELVRPQARWRVLDVATGAGHAAVAFAPHVATVLATDITPEMLEETVALARSKGAANVTTQIADAEALPFENGYFDLVTCRIAPHHFGDVARFVLECARVLAVGGTFALVDNVVPDEVAAADWINRFERTRDHTHHRCLTLTEWVALGVEAGLTVTHTEMLSKPMRLLEWAGRTQTPSTTVAELRAMLLGAPDSVQAWIQSRLHENDAEFSLWEGIVIAHKTAHQEEDVA